MYKTHGKTGQIITLTKQMGKTRDGADSVWWNLHIRKSMETIQTLLISIPDDDEVELQKFAEEYLSFLELL